MNRSNPHGHGLNNSGSIWQNDAAYGGGVGGGGSFGHLINTVSVASTDINHEHGFDFYTDYVYGEVDVNLNHKHGFNGSASVSVGGSCSVTSVSVNTTISGQTGTSGSSVPFNVMQPWTAWNVMIKL
jgi:hypothetical protein